MAPVLFEFNIQGTIEHAFAISAFYHAGVKDKGGQPYFKHPLWIASELLYRGATDTEISVGILHDVIEDTAVTFDMLRECRFSEEIIEAVDALTRREGEDRNDYIIRVSHNRIAKRIKLLDLRHNMDITRLKNRGNLQDKDLERIRYYSREYEFLSGGCIGPIF
jgi:(p)ppGpp synthase/HD superfamily hydrolase